MGFDPFTNHGDVTMEVGVMIEGQPFTLVGFVGYFTNKKLSCKEKVVLMVEDNDNPSCALIWASELYSACPCVHRPLIKKWLRQSIHVRYEGDHLVRFLLM